MPPVILKAQLVTEERMDYQAYLADQEQKEKKELLDNLVVMVTREAGEKMELMDNQAHPDHQ